jgi:iron(III) transport system substrate-binding protein
MSANRGKIMKITRTLLLGAAAALFSTLAARAETELTVYTAFEADILAKYADAFNADHPDVKINWVRDSTGIITAKLLAEKNNPQADVIWGVSATSLLMLKGEGMLEPYGPKGYEALDPRFVDSDSPPSWIGLDAYVAAVCFNTIEAEKLGLPAPTSWKDLTKPVYKGYINMPNPASSGTGFLDVSSWLQMWGEDDGWAFMDALHENINDYTHSGSKPCKQAAAGEIPIGVSFAFRGAQSKAEGAPIDIIVPSEGVGWDSESMAMMAGTDKEDAVKVLMDWAITKPAMELYNEGYAVVAMPGVAKPVEFFPDGIVEAMIKNDFEWAGANRQRILEEWTKRYDSKSEPKG